MDQKTSFDKNPWLAKMTLWLKSVFDLLSDPSLIKSNLTKKYDAFVTSYIKEEHVFLSNILWKKLNDFTFYVSYNS